MGVQLGPAGRIHLRTAQAAARLRCAAKVAAERGQFQQNLPQGRTFQLLRLRIDPALNLIPEISGNRLIVSVRLMRLEADTRLHASNEDAAFELTLCA